MLSGRMEIWEVSQYPPGAQPTPEQQEAADRLIERCERAVQKHGWEDFQKALADGFKLLPNDRRHYYNEEYVFDDRVLDPERPEFLMYYGYHQIIGIDETTAKLHTYQAHGLDIIQGKRRHGGLRTHSSTSLSRQGHAAALGQLELPGRGHQS